MSMVRKGWTHVEVPDGWTQVLRGPRPKVENWPHQFVRNSSAAQMKAKPQFRGRWRHKISQPQQHTAAQVLQSALEALGGIEAALKRRTRSKRRWESSRVQKFSFSR